MNRKILLNIQSGDKEAFKELFEELHPILFRNALYQLNDRDLADDIVQESFLRLWKIRLKLHPDKPVLALLMTISRRLILDHYKHQKVRLVHQEKIEVLQHRNIDWSRGDKNVKKIENQVHWIIENKLPEKCANVFILSRFEGLKNKEIATFLGLSIKTVESHITKAIRIIKKYIPV